MRIYNETEIQALLRQAAALQAAKRDFTTGLTLDEIRRVAEEAGIDPKFVEQAAMGAIIPTQQRQRKGFLGGAYRIEAERIISHEVDAEEWGEMVRQIRETYGQTGTVNPVGNGYEWIYGTAATGSSTVHAHISVTPRRGHTRIHATRRLSNESTVFLMPILPLFFAVIFAFGSIAGDVSVLAPIVLTLLAALAFVGARAWFGKLSIKEQKKMNALLDRLEQIAGESESYEAEQARTAAPPARLDAGLLDEGPEVSGTQAPERRRVR